MPRSRRVPKEARILRKQRRQLRPSIILTAVLALRVFLAPVAPESFPLMQFSGQILVACALVYMAATTNRHLAISGTLAGLVVVLESLKTFVIHVPFVEWIETFLYAALLIYVFWLMLKDLFTATDVDATTLLLAVDCYLVIGIIWAFFYVLVEHASPGGAFLQAGDPGAPVWKHLYYFSIVTLTTLGYGDIQPVSPVARSLAMAEAVGGVLFTGILVARLVGLYGKSTKN